MRKIIILGASGSIGSQAIDVILKNRGDFQLIGVSVGKRTKRLGYLIKKFPELKYICIANKSVAKRYQKKFPDLHFYFEEQGLLDLIKNSNAEMVVNALVGFVGLLPTITALKENKIVALANKESLVVGGELINKLLKNKHGKLYPIDSEHVALDKCLKVAGINADKLIITASGGSFRNLSRDELKTVSKEDALNHPTWKMGAKITIDSATMVNKTFEIIEAYYLFSYPYEKISLLLHKESLVHSMVQLKNGHYKVEKCKPDMRKPIKYALYETLTPFTVYDVEDYHTFKDCSFKEFDYSRFPIVKWAKTVIEQKGTYGAVLNASNEVAVYAFLENKIPFLAIEEIINICMREHQNILSPSLEEIVKCDILTRKKALELVSSWR